MWVTIAPMTSEAVHHAADAAPKLGRRPLLDGLRGVAIIFVLCRHVSNEVFGGAGIVGVDLFFVLSGFLITKLLLEEYDRDAAIRFGHFYGRRAVRLVPALLVMVALFLAVGVFVYDGADRMNAAWSSLFAVTYMVPPALALGFDMNLPLSTTWTLAVEEYYYFAWPLLLVVMIRMGLRGRRLLAGVLGLIVAATLIRVATYLVFDYRIYTAPTTWVDALLGGSALAIAFHSGMLQRLRIPRAATMVAFAGLIAFALWPGLRTSGLAYGPGLTVLALLALVVVATCIVHGDRPEVAWLAHPVATWFGRRSYAIYLWNSVFLLSDPSWLNRPTQAVLGVAATLIVAEASWRLVERPAQQRFKPRFAHRPQRRSPA